jgi:hypothetical protein
MSRRSISLDYAPRIERIHTNAHEHREGRKNRYAQTRLRGSCYKHAYTRKQALGKCNELLAQNAAQYLRTYKCQKGGHYHLTHQTPRNNKL